MIIKPSPTWTIYDSTKLKCAESCMRKYFFDYVLGWKSEGPSIHLEFGQAWHIAMEQLLIDGYGKENIERAVELATAHYRKFWEATRDADYAPKNPGTLRDMLCKYVAAFGGDDERVKTLYTETSGTVAISEDNIIHFKLDGILEDTRSGRIFIREHKTASRRGNQWNLSIQIGTYYHVGMCLVGADVFRGVQLNEAIFQKTNPGFNRTFISKSVASMAEWLYKVNSLIDHIKAYHEMLEEECEHEDAPFMYAFPKNTETCQMRRCEWYDYCVSWANPIPHCEKPPIGMEIKHWNPSEIETTNKVEIQ